MIKLDYTLQTIEERKALVEKILEENPELQNNSAYLEVLADYLVLLMAKEEKRQIITDNRMVTVNRRETSYEGLASQFENGEDGIYNIMTEDKNQIFRPKVKITKKDLEEIPELRQIKEAIKLWEEKSKTAIGRDGYVIKNAIIELSKDQYLIKDAYRKPIHLSTITFSKSRILLDEEIKVTEFGQIEASGITLLNPKVVSLILNNYSKLKQDSKGNFETYTYYLMEQFDEVCGKALADFPLYDRIVELKVDGLTNSAIQEIIEQEFGICHSVVYISSLWRNKIPKLIASQAEDDYLNWYYLEKEKGKYKRCSCCGEIKLALPKYFSKNKTSKDGFYSLCKKCRSERYNKKRK